MKPRDRLGAYEIVSPLGAGGMGDVYKARDPRLDRDVAIKILTAQLAGDADAVARFEREALSVAKLSHPNILAIYEFGRAPAPGSGSDVAYVVTELVDGETLRARLAHGPLQSRRAVAYAQQIAHGMAAAHARGIVHRDLKPENVMITRDDHVKILDFGLAKPIAGVGAAESVEETRAVNVKTTAGTVLGTFGYMAPEQVRGLAVDHRTDIFSFGALLYEMLSGERAFKGETAADTITAILSKDPPDLDVATLAIPAALDRIVRRCLEKAPELRFQSANDLAFALENLQSTSTTSGSAATGAPTRARSGRAGWLPWSLAAISGLALAAVLIKPSPQPDAVWQRFSQLTDAAGEETFPTITPDGTTVAYIMRQNGHWEIYAQRVGGHNPTPIIVDPNRDLGGPAYSPDGASIAFHESDSDGGVFIAGATGESARRLTDIGFNPAWSPDGRQIAFAAEEAGEPSERTTVSSLYIVDAAGGTPRRLTADDGMQPAWSPDGRRIAYWSNTAGQRDIYTVVATGGARTAVTNDVALDWSPEWSPDGKYIYFSSDRGGAMNIWRIAVDERSGTAQGQPEPVTNGVQASASLQHVTANGNRMVFRSRVRSINPVAIPFDPSTGTAGVPRVLDASNDIRIPSSISPDGKELALFSNGATQEDIYLSGADGSAMHRLTDDAPRERAPVFTHDGKSVVFYSNRDGDWRAWTMRIDGSGLRRLTGVPDSVLYPIPSPIDDRVVFTLSTDDDLAGIVHLAGSAAAQMLPNTKRGEEALNPVSWSPDGTKLAGSLMSRSGRYVAVGTYALSTHTMTVVSEDPDALGVVWLPDNRHILYFTNAGTALILVDTVTLERRVVSVQLPGPVYMDVFGISRDGRTIYCGVGRAQSDIWVAQKR